MAHHVEEKMRVNIPADQIWKVLGDFSSIEKFSMNVEKSPIISDKKSGLGTVRKCDFYDKTSVIEEITEYHEGTSFKVVLSEYSMPLKSLRVEMKVEAAGANFSDISMSMDYVVKGGPLGWLMGNMMMRPMMRGIIKKTLTGLAYHSTTGKLVSNELPNKDVLSLAFNG